MRARKKSFGNLFDCGSAPLTATASKTLIGSGRLIEHVGDLVRWDAGIASQTDRDVDGLGHFLGGVVFGHWLFRVPEFSWLWG
jgi:hypothetical protein